MKKISIILCMFVASGCMTAGNDLPKKALKTKDRLYVGRVFVEMNGQNLDKCEITINGDLAPHIKVGEGNWVVYKTDRKKARFSHITCLHKANSYLSAWHEQELPLGDFDRPEEHTTIVHFGDIYIKWETEDGVTEKAANEAQPHEPRFRIGRIKNSGNIKVEIKPALEDAKAFLIQSERGQIFQAYNWQESIVGVQ